MANEVRKDNTEEIMKNERMVISFNPKQVLKRLAMIILVVFWIISVAKPGFFTNLVSKTKEKKVEVTSKEIVMVEKIDNLYVTLFDDSTYVSSDNLAELAEKMSESTGKTFAADGSNLKCIDGGLLTTVDIATYRK